MGVPGHWTVTVAHDVADQLEATVAGLFPGAETFIHVEPDSHVDQG